ncbi:MAG: PAC2 family protein [Candidatus Hodarchaeales archaeon]
MHLESLTGEIEDWLEKADEEEILKFLRKDNSEFLEETVVIEMLGYYGSVDRIIANEIQKLSQKKKKLAGFFSSYFNEMVQLYSGEIMLPITLLQSQIGLKDFILTTSSFAIPDIISYRLAEELYEFYKKCNISKILLVDGVHNYQRHIDKKPQVHRISISELEIKVINQKTTNFTLMGQIASSFLTYWRHNANIPIEILVVDAFSDYDPVSSFELLKVLTQDLGIKGDFNELERKSQEFNQSYLESQKGTKKERQDEVSDSRFFT